MHHAIKSLTVKYAKASENLNKSSEIRKEKKIEKYFCDETWSFQVKKKNFCVFYLLSLILMLSWPSSTAIFNEPFASGRKKHDISFG